MAKLKTGRHTSSLKAARSSLRRRWSNVVAKTAARGLVKELTSAIQSKNAAQVQDLLPKVMSAMHRMGKNNTVHHANAARKIARLSRAAHKALGKTA